MIVKYLKGSINIIGLKLPVLNHFKLCIKQMNKHVLNAPVTNSNEKQRTTY